MAYRIRFSFFTALAALAIATLAILGTSCSSQKVQTAQATTQRQDEDSADREPASYGDCRVLLDREMLRGDYMLGDPAYVEFLPENEASWVRRLKLIESATKSILTQYFIVAMDDYALGFLGALLKKQLEGVHVRLMIDALGSQKLPRNSKGLDLLQELVEAGAEVTIYAPLLLSPRPRLVGSNHDKILLVDECHLVTGGRNIDRSYLISRREDPEAYTDADVHVESALVALDAKEAFEAEQSLRYNNQMKSEFLGNWKSRKKELLDAYEAVLEKAKRHPSWNKSYRPRTFANTRLFDNTSKFNTVGGGKLSDASRSYEQIVADAKSEIVLMNPYILLGSKLKTALVEAAKRGIPITLVTNSPNSNDSKEVQARFEAEWPGLLRDTSTLRIFVSKGPELVHAKIASIDQAVGIVGSFNLDPLSHHQNSEELVMVESRAFSKHVRRMVLDYLESNTVEYKLVNGHPVGPELLADQKKVRGTNRMKGISSLFRDSL